MVVRESLNWISSIEIQALSEALLQVGGTPSFSALLARHSAEIDAASNEPAKVKAAKKAYGDILLLAEQTRERKGKGKRLEAPEASENGPDKELWTTPVAGLKSEKGRSKINAGSTKPEVRSLKNPSRFQLPTSNF